MRQGGRNFWVGGPRIVATASMALAVCEGSPTVADAPRWLRHSTDAWLAVLFAAIFVIYLI